MLGYIVLLFSLPNYANSIGLTAKQGSIVGAILNLGQGLGRPPIGYFSDSVGRINIAAVTTFMSGLLALVLWVNAKSFGVSNPQHLFKSSKSSKSSKSDQIIGPNILCVNWRHSRRYFLANSCSCDC
jgi:MFS family permease